MWDHKKYWKERRIFYVCYSSISLGPFPRVVYQIYWILSCNMSQQNCNLPQKCFFDIFPIRVPFSNFTSYMQTYSWVIYMWWRCTIYKLHSCQHPSISLLAATFPCAHQAPRVTSSSHHMDSMPGYWKTKQRKSVHFSGEGMHKEQEATNRNRINRIHWGPLIIYHLRG